MFYTEVLSELDRKYDPTYALENMVSNLNLAYYKRKEAIVIPRKSKKIKKSTGLKIRKKRKFTFVKIVKKGEKGK